MTISTRNLRPSGTDVSWHCSLNPCSSKVNLWLLSLRYHAISRRHNMRAVFASSLQSCDKLQYGDVVIRFVSAEAGTSITSRLNHISSFRTGNLSITISFSLCAIYVGVVSKVPLSLTCFLAYRPTADTSGESTSFRRRCLHQSLPTPL